MGVFIYKSMPNHCSNELSMVGRREDLVQFLKEHPDEPDLMVLVPCEDSYEGHIAAWGTKWGCYDGVSEIEHKDGESQDSVLTYTFHTAWEPFDVEVLRVISTRPGVHQVTLRYAEQGRRFCGKIVMRENTVVSKEHRAAYPWEVQDADDRSSKDMQSKDEQQHPDDGSEVEYDGDFAYRGEYMDLWLSSG